MAQQKKSLEQVRANLNGATDTSFRKPARAHFRNEFQFQVSYDCCAKRLQMFKREKNRVARKENQIEIETNEKPKKKQNFF